MENVVQMDTTGGSRLGEQPFSLVKGYIIIFAKDNPPKDTLRNTTMLIYIITTVYVICCHLFAFE